MKLLVFITLHDATQVTAGTLDFGEILPRGRYQTTSTSAREWLEYPAYFPLDPESMAPKTRAGKGVGAFTSTALGPPLLVFHDSLPDDWDRLSVTERKLEGVHQASPCLLREIGNGALGALSFFEPGVKPLPKEIHAEQVPRLDCLMAAAERFEAGDRRLDESMLRLLASGGIAGGARGDPARLRCRAGLPLDRAAPGCGRRPPREVRARHRGP